MLKERASRFAGDQSLSTRWAILRPLVNKISVHPVLGSGFGSRITYKTSDPRALAEHPDGFYTTTAFEWGYLDMILEFGYAIPTGRMTKDVDLAVLIKGWKDYEQLKDALAATGEFVQS